MIRAGTGANAMHAALVQTPGANGVAFQRRTATGGTSTSTQVTNVPVGSWLRLVRAGNNFTASYSTTGTTWTPIGATVNIALPTNVRAGLCVTSHNPGTLCTATFTNVVPAVEPLTITTPALLPAGFVESAFALTFAATGGDANRTWALSSGALPGGLTLTAAGTLSGVPTATGSFGFGVQVADGLGNATAQTFTLPIEQPPFEHWSTAHFTAAQGADPAIGGPHADPDHDGLANLLEWASRRDPWHPESVALKAWSLERDAAAAPARVQLSFPRRRALAATRWALEISDDLTTWDDAADYGAVWQTADDANGLTETVTVMLELPAQFAQRASLRLRLTREGS